MALLLHLSAKGRAVRILCTGDPWLSVGFSSGRDRGRGRALTITVDQPDIASCKGAGYS